MSHNLQANSFDENQMAWCAVTATIIYQIPSFGTPGIWGTHRGLLWLGAHLC